MKLLNEASADALHVTEVHGHYKAEWGQEYEFEWMMVGPPRLQIRRAEMNATRTQIDLSDGTRRRPNADHEAAAERIAEQLGIELPEDPEKAKRLDNLRRQLERQQETIDQLRRLIEQQGGTA